MEKKKIIIEISILFVLTLVFGTGTFGSPLNSSANFIDEGQFAAWANHMLNGKVMYEDIYITYGPLYVYPLYLIFKLISPSIFLLKLYLIAGAFMGLIGLVLISSELKIRSFFRWFLYILIWLLPGLTARQAFGIWTIYFLYLAIKTKRNIYSVLTGLSSLITFLISPEVGIACIIISLLLFSATYILNSHSIQLLFRFILSLLFGVFVFAIVAAADGWLISYIDTSIDVFKSFSGINLPNGQGFPQIPFLLSYELPKNILWFFSKEALVYYVFLFYILQLPISLYLSVTKKRNFIFILIISLFGFSFLPILIGRSGVGHYYFVLSPLFIILAFYATRLMSVVNNKQNHKIALIGLVFILLFILRNVNLYKPLIVSRFNLARIENSGSNYKRVGPMNLPKKEKKYIKELQDYIDKNSSENNYVFFLSNEPLMYMLVNRVNPSRYDLPYIPNTIEKRYELLTDLKLNPPKYIFYDIKSWPVDGVSNKERLPELMEFIKENYINSTIVNGRVEVYSLKINEK